MYSIAQIKKICKLHKISPLKSLGQHFLIDKKVRNMFLQFADIKKSDIIIEIGPGLGALTFEIAKYGGKVLAIEKDKKLTEILKQNAPENVEIINKDILKLNIVDYLPKKYKLISDVPYNISSPLIKIFFEDTTQKPSLAVLMLQKEFAQKILAKPPYASSLGIILQSLCNIKKISDIAPDSFWPKPDVKSSLMLFKIKKFPLLKNETFAIIRKCFIFKRKKILKTLTQILNKNSKEIEKIFINNNININARPQNLSLNDWQNIEQKLVRL